MDKRGIILVTGVSRGIGRKITEELVETAGEYVIVGTMRSPSALPGSTILPLDLRSEESIRTFIEAFRDLLPSLSGQAGVPWLHCLINNAGVYPGGQKPVNDVRSIMAVNFHGPRLLSRGLKDLFQKGGRIVNISSGLGELSGFSREAADRLTRADLAEADLVGMVEEYCNGESKGWPTNAYNASKGALNALTRIQHRTWHIEGVDAISVCPGWVQTDMGGAGAPRSIDKGAETPVWAATTDHVESGRFYRDRKVIPW